MALKNKEEIKKKLAEHYRGKEAEIYDKERMIDVRSRDIFERDIEIIKRFLSHSKKGKLLDVACGTGRAFPFYGKREIYGVDISEEMLKQAEKLRAKAEIKELKVCDAEKLPYKDETFSVTTTSRFICHTPNYKKVIKEMARVTQKGGSLIIEFPNKYSVSYLPTKIRLLTGKLRNYNLFSLAEIRRIAEENNLDIAEKEAKVFITPKFFPRIFHKKVKKLNKLLVRLFPNFSYPYYVRFIKK